MGLFVIKYYTIRHMAGVGEMEEFNLNKKQIIQIILITGVGLLIFGAYQFGYKEGGEMVLNYYVPYVEDYCICFDNQNPFNQIVGTTKNDFLNIK